MYLQQNSLVLPVPDEVQNMIVSRFSNFFLIWIRIFSLIFQVKNCLLSRGKLVARERINLLLDPGSPFLELSQEHFNFIINIYSLRPTWTRNVMVASWFRDDLALGWSSCQYNLGSRASILIFILYDPF